jgi:hypothetical protein
MGQDNAGKSRLGRSFALPAASLYRWFPCTLITLLICVIAMSNVTPFEVPRLNTSLLIVA